MTANFPSGPGTWPAFWILSQNGFLDKTATRTEIDAIEWYGDDPKGLHSTIHLWPALHPKPDSIPKHLFRSTYYNLMKYPTDPPQLTDGKLEGFHSYGAEITPDWVVVYFDRR